MVRRLLPVVTLFLLLASRAQAAPITVLLTAEFYEPTVGDPALTFGYRFFESPTNGWPGAPEPPALLEGHVSVMPGVWQFSVPLDVASLNNVYFVASGTYLSLPPFNPPFTSLYVAEPPTGAVPDSSVNGFGPPWIGLADLGGGFGGDFHYFYGYTRGPIGKWDLAPADPVTPAPVPEPASMLLLGSGLAAVASRKYRVMMRSPPEASH